MFIEPYLATVTIFAGNFAPRSWAFCDGSLQSIAQNTPLYALIGTTYGGDGINTFALPDLRGRSALGTGQGPGQPNYVLGQMSGTENTTLLVSNLPMHNHVATSVTGSITAVNDGGNQASPSGNSPAELASRYSTAAFDGQMAPSVNMATTPIAGANSPVSNLSPYLAMNYIIAVEGIFPSRN